MHMTSNKLQFDRHGNLVIVPGLNNLAYINYPSAGAKSSAVAAQLHYITEFATQLVIDRSSNGHDSISTTRFPRYASAKFTSLASSKYIVKSSGS